MDNDDLWHQARVYETDFRQFQLVNYIGGGDASNQPNLRDAHDDTRLAHLGVFEFLYSHPSGGLFHLLRLRPSCFIKSSQIPAVSFLLSYDPFVRSTTPSLTTQKVILVAHSVFAWVRHATRCVGCLWAFAPFRSLPG